MNKTKLTDNITQNAVNLARHGVSHAEMDKILDLDPGSIEEYSKRSPNFRRAIETAELNVTHTVLTEY